MTPKLRNGLIFGGLALATFGIIAYFSRQYKLLKDSCYTIAGGVVHNIGLNNVSITLFFKIMNESDLTIQASDMVFNLYVNNMYVTKILKPDVQTLYSGSEAIVQLDFQFNPKDLLRAGLTNIAPIIYDKEKLVIGIKGNLSLKTGGVSLNNFPFDEEITLKELLTPSPTTDKCANFKNKNKIVLNNSKAVTNKKV